ncbi:MAG: GNAT family N-acetyltransferase [Pseudomonadota bacterium]
MTPDALLALTEATWPPASRQTVGTWIIRDGQGGGQRVSAATPLVGWTTADIPQAEAAMQTLNQPLLFLIRPGDEVLDDALAQRGYHIGDPVVAYCAPTNLLAETDPPFLTTFPHWPPLGIARQLWAEAGTGPARLAVMDRVRGPKTVILGRTGDRAAGVAFVACHGADAMLHALEVAPALRRQGTAHNILRAAAQWAQGHDATQLFLLVTAANETARRLYASLGMQLVGQYHYRKK